ncbi:MAG TPA: hypothetical protein VLA12_03605, partial [Planctomycetaceae bacterium]|nr:hypothetical protein [Planctomycetaceae bacterium]
MTQRKHLLAVAVLMSAVLVSTCSNAADPRLSLINPRGGQRGTELEVVFSGNRLEDAAEIFYYEPGFETLKLEPVNANACKAVIKIAPDARLGEHVMQVRTKSGISDYRTFWVGPYP